MCARAPRSSRCGWTRAEPQLRLSTEADLARVGYVRLVGSPRSYARRHALDALIIVGALEGALEVAVRQHGPDGPTTSVAFAAPAVAVMILPLLARRRFPFGAPAAVWLL